MWWFLVVDLAVVVVVVVACLWLLFVIGVATALGVHVVVAAVLPSFLLPCFLASFLPSFLLPCFLACFLPSFLPAVRSLQEKKKGIKVFLGNLRKWHGIHPKCKEHAVFLGKTKKTYQKKIYPKK